MAGGVSEILHRFGHQDQGGLEIEATGVCDGGPDNTEAEQRCRVLQGEGGHGQESHSPVGGEIFPCRGRNPDL